MQDVAEAAGVALGTVSNVLNHPGKVSASTAQRVRDAIERLGFVRNDAARSLASGSNNSIGFVLADLDNSLFVDMAHGAQQAARAAGYHLLLASAECEMTQQDQYLDLFDEARVAGVLLAPMEDSAEAIARMRSHRRQIVLLNFAPQPGSCCSVLVDNERVGYLAAKHLIEAGRRRLVFVAARDDYQPVRDRRRGIRRAAEEAGAGLVEIDSGGLRTAHGRQIGARLAGDLRAAEGGPAAARLAGDLRAAEGGPAAARLAGDLRAAEGGPAAAWLAGDLPDGIIAVTDQLANGIAEELVLAGVRVPAQVAIVGCENDRSAGSGPMPLTAVDAPGRMMGREAVRLLLDELSPAGRHRHATVALEPELIVRASSRLP
jgi:LacI family transcriptional regulator